MIKVGIIGSSGYVAGELLRSLANHPMVEIDFLYSHSQSGKAVVEIHQDLLAFDELVFSNQINPDIDVVFLCLGHGNSTQFLLKHTFAKKTKIIDLSNDFRLKKDAFFDKKKFIYGLIELNKEVIKKADYIANPGCFATAIQLGLLPLAHHQLLEDDVHIHALTGSTGAGQSPSPTTHFSWRNNNVSIYKAFTHQHLGEINESMAFLQKQYRGQINFLPIRGDFTRGIFASIYMKCSRSEEDIFAKYQDFYKDAAFTYVTTKTIHLKQVVNTNNCLIQIQKIEDKILVTSIIDNLVKGAAGQAIQNMNLMFGIEETIGLDFKASYF